MCHGRCYNQLLSDPRENPKNREFWFDRNSPVFQPGFEKAVRGPGETFSARIWELQVVQRADFGSILGKVPCYFRGPEARFHLSPLRRQLKNMFNIKY